MKIVVDTNVFISGVFFSGPPFQILKLWQERKIQILITLEILDEYKRVSEILANQFPAIDLNPILNYLLMNAELITPSILNETICDDPDDDKFIACAIAGNCKTIVIGDKHLLRISGYQNIEVLKPREFLNQIISSLE